MALSTPTLVIKGDEAAVLTVSEAGLAVVSTVGEPEKVITLNSQVAFVTSINVTVPYLHTTNVTAGLVNINETIEYESSSPGSIILPEYGTGAGQIVWPIGAVIWACQVGAAQVKFEGGTLSVKVLFPEGLGNKTREQWSTIGARLRANNEWVLFGDLV